MSRQWTINDFRRSYEESEGWTSSTYTSEIEINGNAVEINIQLENCEVNDHAEYISNIATQHITWCVNNIEKILAHVADKMTPAAQNWLEDDESELTAEDIKDRIGIKSIHISGTGEFDIATPIIDGNLILYFNDDDIFAGHLIKLWVNKGYVLDDDPDLLG